VCQCQDLMPLFLFCPDQVPSYLVAFAPGAATSRADYPSTGCGSSPLSSASTVSDARSDERSGD